MKKLLTRLLSSYLVAATAFLGIAQSAQASMITSEQLVAQSSGAERARLSAYLERADVVARLEQFGVSAADAKARVAAMSDEEALAMSEQIDQAPAGGIIEVIVFIFLVLLITDILGFTKVFPFTRSVR
jgi:hypothetical protein